MSRGSRAFLKSVGLLPALIVAMSLPGCRWEHLIVGALATPTSTKGASTNVAIKGDFAYVASSALGIEIIGLADGRHRWIPPSAPADRVDDVAVAGDLLFALDATAPGHLSVYRIDASGGLQATGRPMGVPVGPFSGVTAAAGVVIVSGGTSQLTLRTYTPRGELGQVPATADFGRGQPDAVLSANGSRALISTHVFGPEFGLTVAEVHRSPPSIRELGYIPLEGAGFTDGGFKPANFPLQAAFDGDFALIAHGGGLSVLAIAKGKPPKLVASLALPIKAVAIAFDPIRHVAYIVGASPAPGIVEVDLTSPALPRLLRHRALPRSGSPSAIALGPHLLIVAMQAGGVYTETR